MLTGNDLLKAVQNLRSMTEQPLSPAAQAVRDAAYTLPIGTGLRGRIAAALRTAAEEVVPKGPYTHMYFHTATKKHIFLNLLAIAAELEGSN